jgi:ABC-type antimicrobial peptide transport system permease subunit
LVGLLLAAIGIYGTLSFSVIARTKEIGVRMAIGAQRVQVVSLVLRDLIVIMFAGLPVGLLLALGATRSLESFLFGVRPVDPLTLFVSVMLIVFVAILAAYFPATRAAKVDPMLALRNE